MIRLKIQFRIPGYYLVIPWILFLLLSVVHEPPMSGLVLAGGVITQTLIFLGMIMGYRGGLRDRKQGGEYLFLFPGSYTAGWLSILAEWCFFILIQIPVFLYIFWRGIAGGEESWYFKQTFLYLV